MSIRIVKAIGDGSREIELWVSDDNGDGPTVIISLQSNYGALTAAIHMKPAEAREFAEMVIQAVEMNSLTAEVLAGKVVEDKEVAP